MKYSKLLILGLGLLAAVGCASEPGPYEGTWSADCQSNGDGTFTTTTFNITPGHSAMTSTVYDSWLCTNTGQIMTTSMDISLTIGAAITPPAPGIANEVDEVINSASITPLTAAQVTALNTAIYCGINTWQLNVPQNILNTACVGVSPHYTAYADPDNDNLMMALPLDGSTTATRDITFPATSPFDTYYSN